MTLFCFAALAVAALCLAARWVPHAETLERVAAASVLVPAFAIGLVYVLSALHAIAPWAWLLACIGSSTLVIGAVCARGHGDEVRQTLRGDAAALCAAARELQQEPAGLAMVAVGLASVAAAVVAAGLLEPWAWDALGYHLPIVHDAMQTQTLRTVPTSVLYVNCYPRLIDVFFVAWRLGLQDETWVELGQLPFTLVGVTSIAALARRAGVSRGLALATGCLWLGLPIVMLQLATAYVDVAVASLCLATFLWASAPLQDRAELVLAVTAGLLLGSKPSAPPIAAVALLTVLVRTARARRLRRGLVAVLGALAIGAWKYLENLRDHGNPIWPAEVHLGPIALPGRIAMAELAASNLPEPYRSMGWPARVLASWLTIDSERWVFDMRLGGFGPLFTLGLLPCVLALAVGAMRSEALRARLHAIALPVGLTVGATLASPGAFWSRYTIAVPGALLVLAAAGAAELSPRTRQLAQWLAVGLAITGIWLARGGFTDGGVSLPALAALAPEERVAAHAVDDQEAAWRSARMQVGPEEAFGYDACLGLPSRLVRRDGRGRVEYFAEAAPSATSLVAWVEHAHVRVVALHDGAQGAAALARAQPEHFRERFVSAYPTWQPCVVFDVLDAAPASDRGDRSADHVR